MERTVRQGVVGKMWANMRGQRRRDSLYREVEKKIRHFDIFLTGFDTV
jgi:hypothetical protein